MTGLAMSIRNARRNKGWSVYRLAKESGVDTAVIYRAEQGKTNMRLDNYQRLINALKG